MAKTVEMVRYCGFRWVRAGIEGLTDDGPTTMQTFLELHRQTGARLSWGLVSGGSDLKQLIKTGKVLAQADALLAFEGNNEPNNWPVEYQGEKGGGREYSWASPMIIGTLTTGVVCFVLWIFVEHRAAEPLIPLEMCARLGKLKA